MPIAILDDGAHWRNLENTTELSVCGGDAALLAIPNLYDVNVELEGPM